MSNIISWFIGLLSLANIKAELVSLKSVNAELKNKNDLYEVLIKELVEEVKQMKSANAMDGDNLDTEIENWVDDNIESRIQDWADNNLDDAMCTYIEGYDFSDIVQMELGNTDFVTESDLRDKVLEYVEEDIQDADLSQVARKHLEEEVTLDWFGDMVKEEIVKQLKAETSEEVKQNDEAINDIIKNSIESKVIERMEAKFGEGWDAWYEEHTRFCVKVILSEFLQQAYEQTKAIATTNTETK
jgi:uncharacterized membrane protein YheB (UPF0754 family)